MSGGTEGDCRGVWSLGSERAGILIFEAVPRTSYGRLVYSQEAVACPSVIPNLHRIEYCKTDELEAAFKELCNTCIRPSV